MKTVKDLLDLLSKEQREELFAGVQGVFNGDALKFAEAWSHSKEGSPLQIKAAQKASP